MVVKGKASIRPKLFSDEYSKKESVVTAIVAKERSKDKSMLSRNRHGLEKVETMKIEFNVNSNRKGYNIYVNYVCFAHI